MLIPFDLDHIGAGLPFAESVPELERALSGGVAVVQAPPGTGKTTVVPPLVANLVHGTTAGEVARVVVVQPRRVAARAAARRLAALTGTEPGGVVGWSVRGERKTSKATRVEFVTPGILLRRLLRDPELTGTAAVVLDEVHERGVESDLLVGMLAELRQLREDLVLVAMSATVEAERFAALLGGDVPAPVVDCPSALHPLGVEWAPGPQRLDERGVTPAFLSYTARTAADAHRKALAQDPSVDALVFLPGAREVSRVAAELRGLTDAEVLELHGQLPPREQDRAVAGRATGERPRIVVTTSLAESSLTVHGARLVVDSGLARQPRRDAGRGISGLVTVSASKASAEQRAGRAARQGPGTVVRCYDDAAWGAMPAHTVPEVRTADLTAACLALAVWGSPGGEGMALPDPLPPRARADAKAELTRLSAVAEDGRATDLGRLLVSLPVEPRWGRALLDGADLVGARTAAEVIATVSDGARVPAADIPAFVRGLRSSRGGESARWRQEVQRLERMAAHPAPTGDGAADEGNENTDAPLRGPQPDVPAGVREGVVVGLARPEWVARRMDAHGDQWLLASGTRAGLEAGSPLRHHEWLAVADLSRAAGRAAAGTGAVIRAAAPLDLEHAQLVAGPLARTETRASFSNGRVSTREVRAVGAIELSATPVRADPDTAVPAIRAALAAEGLDLLPWDDAARGLRARLALLRRHLGQPWPAVDDAALLARADEWLGTELRDVARGGSLRSVRVADALRRLLPWPEAARLDELVPRRLEVPSGNTARIDYPEVWDEAEPARPPVVAVKLQECFGWAETPRVADGCVPVQFHLLSPGKATLAITEDLASFWSGPYTQVRAEMRGRYPKHPWPEDPWNAVATAKTSRALRRDG
ncbi:MULTISPECIES: ATP-dependent helicase HrpB [Kocuria]|uniref:ATP-dependent helicase HrpB n=2 Tax=Kocuria rhizophila TaxID=72000 RepID=A0AAX2SBQ0_KOCRH|nr:ATP-dependent helicase HrpB [Kocuria rhizophila]WIW69225.1 ATP-dependent helicase HrpB [Kocuria sp. ChxB]MCT1957221.1 ATP-dependent helicase HrpB [Kocuria rhizophila]MCT2073059.1 ATP-dependent helicase HrpB [Kocuria rhizophila]PMR89850.1 ATP-dependent helicase HrpB [Kocuria rhizophila]TFH99501.1 ATP-dependent helicase HrpB [Kocuria rhizophila]